MANSKKGKVNFLNFFKKESSKAKKSEAIIETKKRDIEPVKNKNILKKVFKPKSRKNIVEPEIIAVDQNICYEELASNTSPVIQETLLKTNRQKLSKYLYGVGGVLIFLFSSFITNKYTEDQIISKNSEIDILSTKSEELNLEVESLKAENSALYLKLESLNDELDRINNQENIINSLEQKIEKLEKENIDLENKSKEYIIRVDQLGKEVQKLNAENIKLTSQINNQATSNNSNTSSSYKNTSYSDSNSYTETQVYYKSCAVARAAGVTPIYEGQPGYGTHLDRDKDGIACE